MPPMPRFRDVVEHLQKEELMIASVNGLELAIPSIRRDDHGLHHDGRWTEWHA